MGEINLDRNITTVLRGFKVSHKILNHTDEDEKNIVIDIYKILANKDNKDSNITNKEILKW